MLLSLQVSVLPAGKAGLLMCVVVVAGEAGLLMCVVVVAGICSSCR